jgi:XTP/dITP diphosphohydrolase
VTLYCATGNAGKLREFRLAAGGAAGDGFLIEPLTGIAVPGETGSTFEENASEKAVYYSRYAPGLLFADDSGLEVDALGGAPGIYSARYAGDDAANNTRVLREMEGVANRAARFVSVIALAEQGELVQTFRGEVEGELLTGPRGDGGFGYDPLFWYPPFGCSLAQVAAERKHAVSHRGKALALMLAWLRANR